MAGAVLAAVLVALALAACEQPSDLGQNGGKLGESTVAGARVYWGEPSSGDPIAVLMLLPGGGWERNPTEYEGQVQAGKSLNGQGYATVAVEYDSGIKGFKQIEAVYKAAKKRYPDLPICANGISAGGHWALMLATRAPDLACVEALAAPTDLTTVAQQDPSGDEVTSAALTAFGQGGLARWSPVNYANKIKAKVLLIAAESDPVVPANQSRELAQALPGAQLMVVPPGDVPVPWAHYGGVPADAQNEVITRELDFLKQAIQ